MNAESDSKEKQRSDLQGYLLSVQTELNKRVAALQNLESEIGKLELKLASLAESATGVVLDVSVIAMASNFRRSLEKKLFMMRQEREKFLLDVERARARMAEVEQELAELVD